MSHPETWTVNIVERIRELSLEHELGPDDKFTYEFDHGYETLFHQTDGGGELHYGGSLHPVDGLCHANPADPHDGSDGICVHCGRTLM